MAAFGTREKKENLNSHFEIIWQRWKVPPQYLLFTDDFTSFSFEQTNIKICFYFTIHSPKKEEQEFIWVRFFCGIFRFCWWNELSLLCPFLDSKEWVFKKEKLNHNSKHAGLCFSSFPCLLVSSSPKNACGEEPEKNRRNQKKENWQLSIITQKLFINISYTN